MTRTQALRTAKANKARKDENARKGDVTLKYLRAVKREQIKRGRLLTANESYGLYYYGAIPA